MKNLLTYVHPRKDFIDDWENEVASLVKVQIDNSLELGWNREDIILVTNFPYEHNGVKAFEVEDENYCESNPTATKIYVIVDLFNKGLIGKDLYWFHDFDAFQLEDITENELEMEGFDVGMTDYGITRINNEYNLRPSTGTMFFKDSAREFFEVLKNEVDRYKANEEVVLLEIYKKERFRHLKEKAKKINITYNLATRKRDVIATYEIAEKPLKVIHFHPFDKRLVEGNSDNMAVCVYGKNSINKVLVTEKLISLFNHYGIK